MPRRRRVAATIATMPAACPSTCFLPAEPGERRVALRATPLPAAQLPAHPFQDQVGLERHHGLVQRRVDLVSRPTRKHPAHLRFPIPAVARRMDRQARSPAPARAPGAAVRDFHPDLGESGPLVEQQPVSTDIRGVVHFEDHIRKPARPHHHLPCIQQGRPLGAEIHELIGLDEPQQFPLRGVEPEIRGAHAVDRRSPEHGHPLQNPHERGRQRLVKGGRAFAGHPRGLGGGVPILHPPPFPFRALDLLTGHW